MNHVESVFKCHRQLERWSCSASAHEFIAKLHGRIHLDAFPLQKNVCSSKAGFQFDSFLESNGFRSQEIFQEPELAIQTLQTETSCRRFPLVSVLAEDKADKNYWHILVALLTNEGVGLADPAKKVFVTQCDDQTLDYLKAVSKAVSGRQKIHMLIYTSMEISNANTMP